MVVLNCHSQPFKYTQFPVAENMYKTKSVWIDKTFSNQDKLDIDNAINQWNYVLNGTMKLIPVSYEFDMEPEIIHQAINEHGLLVLKIYSSSHMIPHNNTLAWVNGLGGITLYVVKNRVPHEMMTPVMLHEIGHVLGADHQDGFTLMNPQFDEDKYSCIDYETVKQVSLYNFIPVAYLNYCLYLK